MSQNDQSNLLELSTEIVAAYLQHNSISVADVPKLIIQVHEALVGARGGIEPPTPVVPAVSVRRSLSPDHIICLDCGGSFKTLKRHIKSEHNLTPDQYRAKWGLPNAYPMVAETYSDKRSKLAKGFGLGKKRAPVVRSAGGRRASRQL